MQQINGVCLSPTNTKQKRPHPEMKRTKSQGTRKIQKAQSQSSASMDESNFGGASGYFHILFHGIFLEWHILY